MGLFAYSGIRKGEVVWAEHSKAGPGITAIPRSREWIEALPPASKKAYCHFMYKTGDNEYQSLAEFNDVPIEDFPKVRTVDTANYMNHSCSPTCWFVEGEPEYTGVMVATRDIIPGEEVTYDYATSEDCDRNSAWACHCGSKECRGQISPQDWQKPEVQAKYKGHFLNHIADKIREAAESGAECAEGAGAPLAKWDPSSSWWRRMYLDEKSNRAALLLLEVDRRNALLPAATGKALDLLNRQNCSLIAHHLLKKKGTAEGAVGFYVEAGRPIPKGELVMLLPPNLLLWEEEVDDFNTCLQLLTTPSGARLFSSSITELDIDNFLCHSCEPNTTVHIGSDLAAGLIANKDIAAGEIISFDYDTTEDDLRGDRGGFVCNCGAPSCRGEILGKLYSPKPPQAAAAST